MFMVILQLWHLHTTGEYRLVRHVPKYTADLDPVTLELTIIDYSPSQLQEHLSHATKPQIVQRN